MAHDEEHRGDRAEASHVPRHARVEDTRSREKSRPRKKHHVIRSRHQVHD